jgi:hypothetical protein
MYIHISNARLGTSSEEIIFIPGFEAVQSADVDVAYPVWDQRITLIKGEPRCRTT